MASIIVVAMYFWGGIWMGMRHISDAVLALVIVALVGGGTWISSWDVLLDGVWVSVISVTLLVVMGLGAALGRVFRKAPNIKGGRA